MDLNPNKEVTFNDVCQPGVFRIVYIPKNKALFVETINVFLHSHAFFNCLEDGTCSNSQLQEDYKQYENENFDLEFLAIGEEFWEPIKRKQVLDELKTSWPGDLYGDN